MIKAPFNFVPLSERVYFPEWADQISQDIPFSDGVSGTIELKITAQTPIFVRNGHTKEDGEVQNEAYKSFSKTPDNKYFIPATSIKGAIRSVMEIMSFGKMRLDKTAKFSQREWDNESLYPLKKQQIGFHCGWICPDGDNYRLYDCGKPMRIAMDKIDQYINSKVMFNHFSKERGIDITKEQQIDGETYDPKTAAYKYKLLGKYNLENLTFDYDGEYCNEYKDNRLAVSENGEFRGTIVLTGQPDKYMYPRPRKLTKGAGKFYEFVFLDEVENSYPISKEDFDHYKFIYSDSPDWKLALSRLDKGGIPVFFRLENKKVKDFGLAYLYKLPYEKSPFETLSNLHQKDDMDLADCIFGYTNGNKSLKGRVQFSNAFETDDIEVCEEYSLALGSPKASYYPIYIEQNGQRGVVASYKTYNDGKISGWKRYVVKECEMPHFTGNEQIDTKIHPVKGSFKGIIRFHNLRPIELGALLSAITFHKTDSCYHQIGQGKPYGFGKVSISAQLITDINEEDTLVAFEEAMCETLRMSWVNTDQIVNLFTLAHEEVTSDDVFGYMHLDVENSANNEFVLAKCAKEYLRAYTTLCARRFVPKSLYEPKREEILKQRKDEEEKQIAERKRLEEEKRLQEIEKKKQENAERKQQKLEAGLSFILKKNVNTGDLLLKDFPKGISRVADFISHNSDYAMTASDVDVLHEWLRLIPAPTKKADKKDFEDFASTKWRQIISWVGEETASQWFNEITK